MKYIKWEANGYITVSSLGGASRSKNGTVNIWDASSDAEVWKINPGPEADAAWETVMGLIDTEAGSKVERERCAKLVERMLKNMPGYTLDIAAAIRRGE